MSQANDTSRRPTAPDSDGQLAVGKHVTDIAVSQQSQRARLSEQLLQGTSCVHGKCTVRVWPCGVAFSEKVGSGVSLKTCSELPCKLRSDKCV